MKTDKKIRCTTMVRMKALVQSFKPAWAGGGN